MNRLASFNLRDVTPEGLPPTTRQPDSPVRMLFLSHTLLGFRRYHERIVDVCAHDPDVDAVQIELAAPLWQKVVGKGVPRVTWTGWDFQPYRHLLMWRARINKWLLGPLPLDRFDVVHIITQGNAPDLTYLKAECARRGWKVPRFVVNIDTTAELEARELGYRRRALRPFIRAEHAIFDEIDLVVCRNRWCSRSVIKDYDVPSDRVLVARNSIKPSAIARYDLPPRRPTDPFKLAFVGNNWVRKSGPRLLRMHQEHLANRVQLHVCSGKVTPDHAARNVVWHGAVEHKRLMGEILPRMDALILPTRNDMHPWAVLEAASVGLPVISTRISGIPEMVRDDESGILCAPDDWEGYARAALKLADNPELCERMGRAAREHVTRKYDPDATYQGLVERLKTLASEPARATAGSRTRV